MPDEPVKRSGSSFLFRNWISLAGLVVALGSFFAYLLLFALDFAHHSNPYVGILAYVVAPGFLFLGLALVVAGYLLDRRERRKRDRDASPPVFTIDLSRPRDRRILGGFAFGSVAFLFLTAVGSYQTYQETEAVQFCGAVCHVPMTPQFVAFQNSPHAHVACVECHVGPGAVGYFSSKISGVRQLYHTVLNNFNRPIRLGPDRPGPSEETCEHCHWSGRFIGQVERTFRHFLSDENNTPFTIRMLVNVGGGDPVRGPVTGAHWHMNQANKVEYISTDDQRKTIPWVRFTDAHGVTTEFRTADFKDSLANYKIHTMDCMDCHSRPAHKFNGPNNSVDLALANGRIDPKIPWVKSKIVNALIQPYSSQSEALQKIEASLRETYHDRPDVSSIVEEAQKIYQVNFFPEMKTDWRTHPDFSSHKDWDGCFSCHDGKHVTSEGKPMNASTDCKACHIILAQGKGEELEKLNASGFDFVHIDSEYSDFSCAECHTGGPQKQ
jgi:nitrate/TMAO reductase-like tetraheme cytochrome c subunit